MNTFFYVFFVTVLPMGCETNPLHFMKKEKKMLYGLNLNLLPQHFEYYMCKLNQSELIKIKLPNPLKQLRSRMHQKHSY